MMKQSLVLIVGLASVLFASCASNPQTNGNGTIATANPSLQKSQPLKQNQIPAQMGDSDERLKTRLTELFELCQRDDLEAAAAYFVYRGPDKTREWKDVLNSHDAAEREAVESLCRRIKGYLDASDSYQFGAVKVEREREGEWHALEVSFERGDKTEKAIFAFLSVNGHFAIGDID
jgi:hypothetical protein